MKFSFLQVKNSGDGLIALSDLLYKDLVNVLTWINVNFIKLSPNQITGLSLIMGIISGYFFFEQNLLLGALFYVFRYCLDWIDGKTARLINKTSRYGAFIDNYSGIIASLFMALGLTFGQYQASGNLYWLFLAPFLIFLLQIHLIESSLFTIKNGSTLKKQLEKERNDINKKGLLTKLLDFMKKNGISEPFSNADVKCLLFLIIPIMGLFFPILKEAIIILVALVIIKEIFWFFYYRKKLIEQDKLDLKEKEQKSKQD